MGIFERLLRPTPFYNTYKQFLKKKAQVEHQRLETKLHPLRVAFYSQFIRPGDLVFDIGANVGNRVSSFLACEAKVVAVEPQPTCVNMLKEKFGNRITVESVGIGATRAELEMQIATDSTVSSFNKDYINSTKERFKYTEWVDTISVPVITMDELMGKYGVPAFCKIDVEGYELEVLKGMHEVVPMLSLEYCVPEMQGQLHECVNYLVAVAPQGKFNYSIGESMKWALSSWLNHTDFYKLLQSEEFTKTSFGDIYFKRS